MISSASFSLPLMEALLATDERVEKPKDRLNIRSSLVQRVIEAIDAFQEGRLSCFDAIVGDQACQIRALQICLLSKEEFKEEFLKAKLLCKAKLEQAAEIGSEINKLQLETSAKVEGIRVEKLKPLAERNAEIGNRRAKAIEDRASSGLTFQQINLAYGKEFAAVKQEKAAYEKQIETLENETALSQQRLVELLDADFVVDERVVFVARAYFLTLIKEVELLPQDNFGVFNYKDKTKVSRLNCGQAELPMPLLEGVAKTAKKAMTVQSVLFVQMQASRLSCVEAVLLQARVSAPKQMLKKEQQELPFFYMTKVIFERALEEKLLVLVKVRNKASNPLEPFSFKAKRLFVGNPETRAFEKVAAPGSMLMKEALVIEAISEKPAQVLEDEAFLDEVFEASGGLLGAIDLNTVQHTQYTDQKIASEGMFAEIPDIQPDERAALVLKRKEAFEKGFFQGRCQAFLIDHVFADKLKYQLQ